jgi:uncharacterized protein involved in exopolysaccharide biosynthesis
MEIATENPTRPLDENASPSGGGGQQRASDALWYGLGTLWNWRRFIMGLTALAAVASVIIALLLPKWYAAEARVLRSEGGASFLGMVNQVTGGLGSLLGGGGGEYTRYLAILSSRSMMERVIDEFGLVSVYDLEANEHPIPSAVDILRNNLEFDVALDYDYLGIRAYDRDPERAAAMANFLVGQLNRVNAELSSQSARETRLFIEQRLREAEAALDSARLEIQTFQEANGVVELESQAEAFMSSMATLKADLAQAEIRYQTLARQYGPDNPQVQAARDAVDAARVQMSGILGGRDALLPISMQELPAATRRYAELMQDQLIQAQIIETIYPLYEQALFQERSETSAVQVVDEAVPPILAARPSRRLIVVATTLTAFLLTCGFVLAYAWLKEYHAVIAARMSAATSTA